MRSVIRLGLVLVMALILIGVLGKKAPVEVAKIKVYVETRDWCPACRMYAPTVEQVRNLPEIAAIAEFVLYEDDSKMLPSSPGYIPYTLINPENSNCKSELVGAAKPEKLIEAVLTSARCQGL